MSRKSSSVATSAGWTESAFKEREVVEREAGDLFAFVALASVVFLGVYLGREAQKNSVATTTKTVNTKTEPASDYFDMTPIYVLMGVLGFLVVVFLCAAFAEFMLHLNLALYFMGLLMFFAGTITFTLGCVILVTMNSNAGALSYIIEKDSLARYRESRTAWNAGGGVALVVGLLLMFGAKPLLGRILIPYIRKMNQFSSRRRGLTLDDEQRSAAARFVKAADDGEIAEVLEPLVRETYLGGEKARAASRKLGEIEYIVSAVSATRVEVLRRLIRDAKAAEELRRGGPALTGAEGSSEASSEGPGPAGTGPLDI